MQIKERSEPPSLLLFFLVYCHYNPMDGQLVVENKMKIWVQICPFTALTLQLTKRHHLTIEVGKMAQNCIMIFQATFMIMMYLTV